MAKVQLLGGAYQARSVIAGMQRSLNLYIQQTPMDQGEPAPAIHLPTPGMVPINTPTRVVDPAYHSVSVVECTLLNLRPRALRAQVFPTSDLECVISRTRDLSSFLFVDTSLVGVTFNPVFRPLSEALAPLSTITAAVARSRPLAESVASVSALVATVVNSRPGLPLNAALLPSSLLRANIVPLVERITPVSLLSSIIGKTLTPKALTAALTPGTVLHANFGALKEAINSSVVLTAGVVKFRAPKPLTAALLPRSAVVGAPHKRSPLVLAATPTSAVVAALHRRRKLAGALAPTSALVVTALSSRLQGHLTPGSAFTIVLKRGHALSANLNPRAAPVAALRRRRPLVEAVVPRSALIGTLRSPGRLIESIVPKTFLSATLSPKSTGQYYTPVRNWFVAPNGNDPPTGQGTSVSPWKTLAGADSSGKLLPGDVVNCASGTYNLTGTQYLNNGGNTNSLTGFVVYKSTVQYGAKLVMAGTTSDDVIKAQTNYVIFDGFEIDGGNAGVATLSAARSIGSCIGCWGHHIIVTNCKLHDAGGSGIQANFKDWYTFDNNICYNNSNWNGNQTSGISIYEPFSVPYTPSAADIAATYRIQVINNTCFNNFIVGGSGITATNHTDGNGIIMDDFLLAQAANPYGSGAYTHASLCQHNTCYSNGGRGVHVFSSTLVVADSNIAYNNVRDQGLTGSERGDVCAVDSTNCTMSNNKSECTALTTGLNPFCTAVLHARSTSITWTGNATYDPRTGARSFNIDNGTVAAAFPGANPLGGPLP